LGPQVRLGLLSTPSHGDAVAFGCSAVARLGAARTFTGWFHVGALALG